MSIPSQATHLEEGRRHLPGIVDQLLRRVASLARFGGNAQWLVVGGRAALIWLPVYTLMANETSPLGAVATTSLVAGVWLLALRAALSTYFTLGPAVASAVGTATGLVAVSALDLWMPGMSFDAVTLAETAFAVFLLSAAWEHVVRTVAKRRVLIVGTNGIAWGVMQELARVEHAPFTVVGVVADPDPAGAPGTTPLGSIPDLSSIVDAQRPDIVILTDEPSSASALDRLLSRAPVDFKVVSVPHFFEHAFGRVPLGYLTPAWFMSMLHLRQKTYTRVAKRAFDLVAASLGLLVVAPLAPLLVALVRTTPGPILYRQQRLGEGGRRFTIYKLRTMRQDAEDAEQPLFAAERDPRATRVGRFLRRTHLDETPQLWNVLRGDMSMVGPRPERPEFVTMLEATVPFWTRRLLVKPGITGWAQLRCGYAYDSDSTADKLSYDLWYLRNRNVIVDLAICAKTFSALVFGSGDRRAAR
jgi:exopolysaccharide biosynthesis polyprenyl glycosylphosphotransferase